MLRTLDIEALPDDYGIDIAVTMSVLDRQGRIGQVPLPGVSHSERQLNSEGIMRDVAEAMLARVSAAPRPDRSDVAWPARYWEELSWPSDFQTSMGQTDEDRPAPDLGTRGNQDPTAADDARVQQEWRTQLARAVRAVEHGGSVKASVDRLVEPFFALVSVRALQPRPALVDAEAYVHALGDKLVEDLA
jgi:hypothetical protein